MADNELGSLHNDVGEIKGQLREVIHVMNNNSMKIDALAVIVATQAEIVRRVEVAENRQNEHHRRLAVLEADKHRREGAIGLVAWISDHWPFTIFAGLAAVFVAWANHRISL